ncbi:MAG: hypothetical protein KA436_08265 [Oligoflexales bacterium]|nr:hypothetical protein [Oligoflexales bacterium]
MSEVLFLRSETNLGSGFLKFPDLKNRLERHLGLAQMLPDLEEFIRSVNDLVKDNRYSPEERNDLKRMRQRAYDRKRNLKNFETTIPTKDGASVQESILETIITEEHTPMALQSIEMVPSQKTHSPALSPEAGPVSDKTDFWSGVQSAFHKVDGERFVRSLPSLLVLLVSSSLVIWFLYLQSLDLYKSSSFSQPYFAAAGGILMIVGFAAYRAVCRTKLALLLCLYAGSYEIYFMASGTVQDEKVISSNSMANDPELVFLGEQAEKARQSYQALKSRYEDPTSGVYKNGWFKSKHLDTAWDKNVQDQQGFLAKKKSLESQESASHVTWLKIFYRLGLVLLCMVLVHMFSRKLRVFVENE